MFNILWNESEDFLKRSWKASAGASGVSVTLALTEQGLSVSTVITHGTIKMAASES